MIPRRARYLHFWRSRFVQWRRRWHSRRRELAVDEVAYIKKQTADLYREALGLTAQVDAHWNSLRRLRFRRDARAVTRGNQESA